MTTEQRVRSLFAEANPAPSDMEFEIVEPSVAVFLATLDERSSEMTKTQTKAQSESERSQRPGPWLVAAAVLLVIAVGAVLFNQARTDVAANPPEIEAVLAAIEAQNAGDIDGWIAAFEEASGDWQYDGRPVYFDEILMNANRQMTVVEACTVVEPLLVECVIRGDDDFHGPAGIFEEGVAQFRLNDQLLIASFEWDSSCCDEQRVFTQRFNSWLFQAHNDVYTSIRPPDLGSLPGYQGDPSDMAIAIEYVEEFVVQSVVYPLDPAGD